MRNVVFVFFFNPSLSIIYLTNKHSYLRLVFVSQKKKKNLRLVFKFPIYFSLYTKTRYFPLHLYTKLLSTTTHHPRKIASLLLLLVEINDTYQLHRRLEATFHSSKRYELIVKNRLLTLWVGYWLKLLLRFGYYIMSSH